MKTDTHSSVDEDPPVHMDRVVTASISGALLEWYDFFVYGTASALFFGRVFFPTSDAATGIIASFATYGAGFFARPLGGIIFGHFGDQRGRKSALIWTLSIVGASTFLIGLLPTYDQVGVWAPILLVALRLVQGFGLGGEYGGAALLTIESAPGPRRGFFGSLPQTAASIGILLATGIVSLCDSAFTDEQMHSWGWRIPFLVSMLMLAVGMFVRTHTGETPEFLHQRNPATCSSSRSGERIPLFRAFRNHPRNMVLAFCARIAETVSSNIINAFGISYVTTQLALDRQIPLNGMLVASAIGILACPVIGWFSDRVGLRRIYLLGAVSVVLVSFPFFLLLGTASVPAIWVALIVSYNLGPTMMFAVQPTLFTSMFGTDVRYTGLSFAYQFSAILGGLTPLICTALLQAFDGEPWGVAAYMAVAGLVSLVATVLIRGSSRTASTAEPVCRDVKGKD
jgi:MHS family shikimate/dehydroshikimate transporter-like MFS transporter